MPGFESEYVLLTEVLVNLLGKHGCDHDSEYSICEEEGHEDDIEREELVEGVLIDFLEGEPEEALEGVEIIDEEDEGGPCEPVVGQPAHVEGEGGRVGRVHAALATHVVF